MSHGGSWKLAHYSAAKAFSPVAVSAAELSPGLLSVFIINDGLEPLDPVTMEMRVSKYSSSVPCAVDVFDEIGRVEGATAANVITLPVGEILDRCDFGEYDDLRYTVQ